MGWNLNYDGSDNITIRDRASQELVFTKEPVEFTKEFIKASRQIYKLISMNPKVSTAQMADSMGLSTRQVLKYLKRLQELGVELYIQRTPSIAKEDINKLFK